MDLVPYHCTPIYVAEQWGRSWITIDTSRVALALARARIMGARYPYYLLADSRDGQLKEAEITRRVLPSPQPLSQWERGKNDVRGDIRQGFVYERVPHITLKSIANNAEIDVIWDKFQEKLEPLRDQLNQALVDGLRHEAHRSRLMRLQSQTVWPGVPASPFLRRHILPKHLSLTRNGKSPASLFQAGWTPQSNSTPTGGSNASPGKRKLTPLSPPKPSSNISTTNPTKTRRKSVSRVPSRWKAFRPIAFWAWVTRSGY